MLLDRDILVQLLRCQKASRAYMNRNGTYIGKMCTTMLVSLLASLEFGPQLEQWSLIFTFFGEVSDDLEHPLMVCYWPMEYLDLENPRARGVLSTREYLKIDFFLNIFILKLKNIQGSMD